MTEKQSAGASFLFAGGFIAWMVWQYNKPKLTYYWQGNALTFNFTKGSKGVNGTVSTTDTLNDNVRWQGDYAFSVVPSATGVYFQISDKDLKIIFQQTISKA